MKKGKGDQIGVMGVIFQHYPVWESVCTHIYQNIFSKLDWGRIYT